MKKLKHAKFIFCFLGLATFASLVGTVSGTLAWYAYSARASLSYSGTSVSSALQLQIGLVSDHQIPHDPDPTVDQDFWSVMTVEEEIDGKYYYFAPTGVGLNNKVIEHYLSFNGYATTSLFPVTSGYYNPDDTSRVFDLYNAPTASYYKQDVKTDKTNFLYLKFAFRVYETHLGISNKRLANEKIWLTDVTSNHSTREDGDIYKAMRVFVDRDSSIGQDFIVNPNAEASGETVVGGLLDLSHDGYFDYDNEEEVVYGEYNSIGGLSSSGFAGDSSIVHDLNNTGITDRATTFTSSHRQGIKYYDNLDNCSFKTAKYRAMNDVKPDRHPVTGALENDNYVCVTGDENVGYVGTVNLKVWLEGWDHSVIDDEHNHRLDLGLTFEINRVDANS